ncbi:hypothetical protein RF679_15705 [Undibacterium cyanobacteriorum]|uniref:Uncharacterized protein n=1 Tax=Undibacterium cyanobacteriorum TaxID=3073561 RepID=A0ABY9RHE2_9BURK|nr:hypothetical protein [Undibacterium sp. 20NA77.5]WMW80079.1 hypothetical protein RF679_15705 [Undibacterium sp. 20NA77.5]
MTHHITYEALSLFCDHLESLASAVSLPHWEDQSTTLEITGLGDPLSESLCGDSKLLALVDAAREVSASQFWTAWKPEEVQNWLMRCALLAGLSPAVVLANAIRLQHAGSDGWGTVVSKDDLSSWAFNV